METTCNPPARPGKDAAEREGDHHVLPGGHAQQVGGVSVPAHRLQAQAEVGSLDEKVDDENGEYRDQQRRRAQARLRRERRQPQVCGKGTVPDMEATPGRFHGPKMSQRLSAAATKFNPSPPKISFTPPKVFRAPASIAHSAPPAMPARIASGEDERGRETARLHAVRSSHVVNIAPKVICPSMPMFHSPR